MLIKDRFTLGAIAGLVGTIPQVLINFISFKFDYTKYYSYQLAAGIHLAKPLTEKPIGIFIGGLIWELAGMVLGILIMFVLIKTGKDFWWLKGIIITNFLMFTVVYGFVFDMGSANVLPEDIGTNLTEMIGNILFGVTSAFLSAKWLGKLYNSPKTIE